MRVPRTPGVAAQLRVWCASGIGAASIRRTTREKNIRRNLIFPVVSREGDGFAIAWKVILKSVRGKLKRFRARFVPYNLANSSQKITRKSRASLSLLSVKQSQ